MRKLLIMLALALAAPAMADEYKISSPTGAAHFAISLPNGWRVTSSTGAEIFFSTNANADFGATAGLKSAGTPLAGPEVKHVDLDHSAVTRDIVIQQGGFPARRIDGTAVSEGDKLSFSSIAIKPAADAAIVQLVVWGPPNLWQRPDTKRQVEDMLGSLKPVRGGPPK